MIGEWVTRGAGIGISAFVAVFVFGVLALACLGFLALGAKVLKEDEDVPGGSWCGFGDSGNTGEDDRRRGE